MTEIFAIIKIWQFDTTNLGVAIMKIKSYQWYEYSNFFSTINLKTERQQYYYFYNKLEIKIFWMVYLYVTANK